MRLIMKSIQWNYWILMNFCHFSKLAFRALINKYCALSGYRISFHATVYIKAWAGISERSNKITSFCIVKVNDCSFHWLKNKVVLLDRAPKCFPYFIKRYKSNKLFSLTLNSFDNIVNCSVIIIALKKSLFFFYRVKICRFFYP